MPDTATPQTTPSSRGWTTLSADRDPRSELAPETHAVVRRLQGQLWRAADPGLLELCRLRIAQLLGNDAELGRPGGAGVVGADKAAAVAQWPTSPLFDDRERAVLGFAEQFVMDVAGVADDLRSSLAGAVGADLGSFVTGLYLLDYGQRTQMVFERLFPGVIRAEGAEGSEGVADRAAAASSDRAADQAELQAQLDEMLKATARLGSLDMVTTEIVRLRSARQHNCRICQSTRSRQALAEGADEGMFDKIDRYEQSDLSEGHKVALRLTDALITQPRLLDPVLVAQVRQQFTPQQAVELVYDVMRNSCQKVAVALAVDDPHVDEGVELYAITGDGDVEFLAGEVA